MIRIHTLGGLSVRGDDGKVLTGAAAQPRRMAILALLARAGNRGATREKVLALLWPDFDDERGARTLAQALYALRTDLGAEAAIAGSKELRLDPNWVTNDAAEFASAVARGDDERAIALYEGPFLDGFHLPGADSFARWVEGERSALAQDYARALESLARSARGDPQAAMNWWRKLAALEPLNARVTVGLMEALDAAGDRAGAIKHAHVYELLLEQELDLPPDKDVMALAERLRSTADSDVASAGVAPPAPASVVAPPPVLDRTIGISAPSATSQPAVARQWATRVALAGLVLVVIAGGYSLVHRRSLGAKSAVPVLAVGRIASYGADSAASAMAAPVSDLLATSLARVPGIQVVSQGRMLELMRATGAANDTTAGGFVNAARHAGATEVIDGTLYARAGGPYRLDLRRIDMHTGAIGGVYTVEGRDLFALVDSGTAHVVAALGAAAPSGSVADVTTRSPVAYAMYEQGMQSLMRFDYAAALESFDRALAADSLFAMAAYRGAMAAGAAEPKTWFARMERAKRLASRAPDRERLTIMADWALRTGSPTLRQLAETLAVRYPNEVEGYLYSGTALLRGGEFLAAARHFEHIVTMDSVGIHGSDSRCGGCQALSWLVTAFEFADSLPAAERTARRWLGLQPRSWSAATALVNVLEHEGRVAEADSTFRAAAQPSLPYDMVLDFQARHLIHVGDYASADQLLRSQARQASAAHASSLLILLVLSLREQGKLAEAFDIVRQLRRVPDRDLPPGIQQSVSILETELQLERGRPAVAAAGFDSIARLRSPEAQPWEVTPNAWMLTQAAGARVAAGDTMSLELLADSIRTLGLASGSVRDQRLSHYVRGLLRARQGRDAEAATELRAALFSVTSGYTRINTELGRVLLHSGRPLDAVAILAPALRGPLDASALFGSRTELHEMLAHAWDAAHVPDSAAAHYRIVARAWSAGDPPFKARADSARAHAAVKGA